MKYFKYLLLICIALILFPGSAGAHKISDSYLRLSIEGRTIRGEWDIALYDLAATAGFLKEVGDNDGPVLRDFALSHLLITSGSSRCTFHVNTTTPEREDGTSPDVRFEGECPENITSLTIDYSPFLVIDPQYRELVNINFNNNTYTTALSAQKPFTNFQLGSVDRLQQFKDYLREGVWHIWLGYDHILFLLSLLLSAAFVLRDGQWQPRDGFTGTFIQVLKIVTAFTVAHSITLSLVIFDVISLPSRLVESAIALSIVIAAANNLHPLLHKRLWLLTFCFGLIHGMGFAGALKELGLPDNARWIALIAFNLGVEIGQITIVLAALPVIYRLRHNLLYRHVILRVMSGLIIAMALLWFVQRAFAIVLLKGMLGL
jgi:hypothetical protein